MDRNLCLLFIGASGQNGPNLGIDEGNIVLIQTALLNTLSEQVTWTTNYVLSTEEELNNNLEEKIDWKTELNLNDEQLNSNLNLKDVILNVHEKLKTVENMILVTDGQLPLRQCLHPQASNKDIPLPDYYNSFFDLKKEAERNEDSTLDDILKDLELPPAYNIQAMINITIHLLQKRNKFSKPETIMTKLEPGICLSNELVDTASVVRARGLPWQSSDQDVAKFFRGLDIAKGGVALCLSPQGRRNGEALVRFISQEHRDMALKRHKHHIGTRYIEVYKASGEDFISVAGGCNNEAQAFLQKGGQVIVRMRGLPYDCSNKQVLEFFETTTDETQGCKVLDDAILFVKRPDGRATGDAFVLFQDETDAVKALARHKQSIGSRYIELFRSTTAEVQQVLNRCLEKPPPQNNNPPQIDTHHHHHHQQQHLIHQPNLHLIPHHVTPPLPSPNTALPQHIITSGTRKDCIRLRGLPYEAQVEHILEFLAEHAKNIVYQGVHMVYNAQGQPSGEAFIQMNSEQSAFHSAQSKHHRIMIMKKQRYIEVFQCSGDDMNLVLSGFSSGGHPPKLPNPNQLPNHLTTPPQSPQQQINNSGFNGMYHLYHRYPQQQLFYYYSPINPFPHFQQNYYPPGIKPMNDLLTTYNNEQPSSPAQQQDKRSFQPKNFMELGLFMA